MGFGADLRAICEDRKLDLEKASRGFTLRLFDAVARDTRVDTGRMRGEWQVTQDSPAFGLTGKLDPNYGAPLRGEMRSKVSPLALNILSNPLPYAIVWEERDAMVGRAIADFERLLREEVEKLQ